jgi:CTD small phosphatase-like protein 2
LFENLITLPKITDDMIVFDDDGALIFNKPYLPSFMVGMKYTLVLDLDETLIHYDDDPTEDDEEGFYMVRPAAMKFIRTLKDYFEIVIFTAAMHEVSFSLLVC